MKKIVILLGICAILIAMPISTATPVKTNTSGFSKILTLPPDPEYDGTFVGGLGRVYKEDGEWQYEVHSYIAGVYKTGNYKITHGNIYNLDEEQIGTITTISSRFFLIGRIKDLEDHKIPIVGFLFTNDENQFIGRIMSLFGPAPHMWGQYTPN
jgi:hypothetical protein